MPTSADPFRGSRSGLTRQQLRALRFRRLSRDVYVLTPAVDDLRLRSATALTALPDAVLSHATAAVLLGLPCPPVAAVHLVRSPDRSVSSRAGLRTHRLTLRPDEVTSVDGLPVTTPARTFRDLASSLSLPDRVVLGDAVVRRCGWSPLHDAVQRARGARGAARARAALPLIDPGSDSPAETRTRLLLHGAGFTDLQHGLVVRDEHGGWISRPDLADRRRRVAVQYDGLVHFEGGAARWRADIDRDELTRAAGWEVVVLTARDLLRPDLAILKVTAAYRRAAARQADPGPAAPAL